MHKTLPFVSPLQVTYIINYLCGHFKEFGRMVREMDDNKIRHIRLGAREPIRVQEKCDSLDEKIELGLQLCKLTRDLDEIGTLIVFFFW